MYTFLLMGGAAGSSQGQGSWMAFLPILIIILIMYFMMFRPQAKRQKEHKQMLQSLQKGDKILTSGGIVGTIAGIKEKENTIIVKIAKDVKIELSRSSVSQVLNEKS